MTSIQYEELCRFFSSPAGKGPNIVRRNPLRSNSEPVDAKNFRNTVDQIDLYWETGDDAFQYLFTLPMRSGGEQDKVDQPDVLLLQQVKDDVRAHKAVMITNTAFTSGANAVAQDKGIALHVVRPAFDVSSLPSKDRPAIVAEIQNIASTMSQPIYEHVVIQRAFDLAGTVPTEPGGTSS